MGFSGTHQTIVLNISHFQVCKKYSLKNSNIQKEQKEKEAEMG
jgi:hypothetical protein